MSEQDRPVVSASRILGAISLLAGIFPIGATAFGWVDGWGAEQYNAYSAIVGAIVTAIALAFGIRVEKDVTPTSNPRDDSLVPLVPIADDFLDD